MTPLDLDGLIKDGGGSQPLGYLALGMMAALGGSEKDWHVWCLRFIFLYFSVLSYSSPLSFICNQGINCCGSGTICSSQD